MVYVTNQKMFTDFYGAEHQARLAMEEAGELIQAINKVLRKKQNAKDKLAEEIADVSICIERLKILFGISDTEIQIWVDYKNERSKERMSRGED